MARDYFSEEITGPQKDFFADEIETKQSAIPSAVKSYSTQAQPAFQQFLRRPFNVGAETPEVIATPKVLGHILKKGGGEFPEMFGTQKPEEFQEGDYADIYRQAGGGVLPFAKSTSVAGQLVPQIAGGALNLGTRPSTYITAGLAPLAGKAAAVTPATRRFLQTQTPTLAKALLNKYPIDPIYKVVKGLRVDITKPLPKGGKLVQTGRALVDTVNTTIGKFRQQYSDLLKPFVDTVLPEENLAVLPKGLLKKLDLGKKTTTIGDLWTKRWDLLKQLNESSFTKEALLKTTKLREDEIMTSLGALKDVVLNSVDDFTKEQIIQLDPLFAEVMKSGRGILRAVFDPRYNKIKTTSLANIFTNKLDQGGRELFTRFGVFDKNVTNISKQMHSFATRQAIKATVKRYAPWLIGSAVLGKGISGFDR